VVIKSAFGSDEKKFELAIEKLVTGFRTKLNTIEIKSAAGLNGSAIPVNTAFANPRQVITDKAGMVRIFVRIE